MDSLLDEIPEDNGAGVVIKVKPDHITPTPPPGSSKDTNNAKYDPALVYILEFGTVLALRDETTVEVLGKRILEVLQAVLRDVGQYHPILTGRATFYLFSLLRASYVSLDLDDYGAHIG